jgi:phenylpyruvate tautomerase PptA (4-oxalocrotonate tautomerase family)
VEDVAFRVLAAGNQPDFRTISDFRKLHLQALEELFQQMLRLTLETGTMKLGRVALDGSKVKGNASKHKAMSYGRMQETEKRLREEVRKLLKQAEGADKEKATSQAGGSMPHVIVKLVPGKSEERKTGLAEAITKNVMEILNYGEEAVSVAFEEVTSQAWARKSRQTPDIEGKWDKL